MPEHSRSQRCEQNLVSAVCKRIGYGVQAVCQRCKALGLLHETRLVFCICDCVRAGACWCVRLLKAGQHSPSFD
eukprot:6478071-Amphidinium_carterae.3